MDNNAVPRYIDIVYDVHNTSSSEETQSTIELSRYSVEGFEQCLANKTVVFIGESRVRFQYMHLGLMLKTGKFMNCQKEITEFMNTNKEFVNSRITNKEYVNL